MLAILEALIRDLRAEQEKCKEAVVSRIVSPEEYARLVGAYQSATYWLSRVEMDLHNFVEAGNK